MCVGDQIAGREVQEEIGMVSAAAVRSKSVLSDMYVALAGLFGGAFSIYFFVASPRSA